MALAIDGTPAVQYAGTASSWSLSLTTTQPGDLIVAECESNGGPITSISSTNLGSFTQQNHAGSGGTAQDRWWAVAASPLTAESITFHSTTSSFFSAVVYAISGANTSAPWDSGKTNGTTDPLSITTHEPNAMVLGAYRMSSTVSPTAGSGYTPLASGNSGYFLSEYAVKASIGTYSVTIGTGAGNSNGGVIDAVIPATATQFVPSRMPLGV